MKNYFVMAFIAVLMCGCLGKEQGWNITIKGKINFPDSNKPVYLEWIDDNNNTYGEKQKIDVAPEGTFEAVVKMTEPGYLRLDFYGTQQVVFVGDRSDLEINADGNKQNGFAEIKGSPDRALIEQVNGLFVPMRVRIKEMEEEFQAATRLGDEATLQVLRDEYADLIDQNEAKIASLLREQGPSVGVITLLTGGNILDRNKYFDLYVHVADTLKTTWADYRIAKNFIALVEKWKKISIGNEAPEITLPDPDGNTVTLSSFKGRYVLIDFWAAWCGPCRKENPNVVRMYEKYHDRGFDILGISLDRKKQEWVRAIKDDGLIWKQVSDLQYFNSQPVKDYNITVIPSSVLVDPDGIIVAKNLRGKELEAKLESIFRNL